MKKIIFVILLLLFAYLIPYKNAQNIYAADLVYNSCEVWACDAAENDFILLIENGFILRTDNTGRFIRACKEKPNVNDLTVAYSVQNKITKKGGFSTMEITGLGQIKLPVNIQIINTYKEQGMSCTEFKYLNKFYQIAVRGDEVIIGTPAISVSY